MYKGFCLIKKIRNSFIFINIDNILIIQTVAKYVLPHY